MSYGPRLLCALVVTLLANAPAVSAQQCVGDCEQDGAVSVSDLIRCVRIAIGQGALDDCSACDPDGDGTVSIAELVRAVGHALCNCQTCPTPAATRTPSPTPMPPTATPPDGCACDFNGHWSGRVSTVFETCGEGPLDEPFAVDIAHECGGAVTAPPEFEGAVDQSGGGCCLAVTSAIEEDGGLTCSTIRICQDDRNSFSGTSRFRFFANRNARCDAATFECEGEEALSATRQ